MNKSVKSIVVRTKSYFNRARIVLGNRLILKAYCKIYLDRLSSIMDKRSEQKRILKNIGDMSRLIPSPFFWQDLSGRIMGLNSRALALIGARYYNEVIGKKMADLYPRIVAEQLCFDFSAAIRNNQDISREYMLEDKALQLAKKFTVNTFPLCDSQEQIFGVITTLTDAEI